MDIILKYLQKDGIISGKVADDIKNEILKNPSKRISEILIEKGIFGDESFCEWMKRTFGFGIVSDEKEIDISLFNLFPKSILEKNFFIPVKFNDGKLVIASPEPFDLPLKKIAELSGIEKVEVLVISPSLVKKFSIHISSSKEGGIEEYLDSILEKAIEVGATDIHLIPLKKSAIIKFRVNGRLEKFAEISPLAFQLITNRIKVISHLDISEKRLPQDGRFSHREYDIRVSIVPTVDGEKTALRILKKSFDFNLGKIGLTQEEIDIIRRNLNKQSGFIFVSGPTGSGKTTTIYSMLLEINRDEFNVFSIEDPVEYFVEGVNQIQINEEIGLTFPKVLKHILRQDPDVIFLGEMRDFESADIAIKSSLTGHLVLSTLHAKDVASSIIRIIDMGIPEYILFSALRVGISQRLVRAICQNCKGRSCQNCKNGFSGRKAIFEIIEFSDDLKSELRKINKLTENDIRKIFRSFGFKLLEDRISEKIAKGELTREEANYVF